MKELLLSFFFVLIFSSFLFAQEQFDVYLLQNTNFEKNFNQRKVTYGFSDNPSKFSHFNPIYHFLSGSMWVYQKIISPQLATGCMYVPSCSSFSKELIKDYGMLKGVFCTADRLTRCNRIVYSTLPRSAFNPQNGKVHEKTDRYSLK